MTEKNTWMWIVGVVVVLAIIGGLWWWMNPAQTPAPADSTGTFGTSTNATSPSAATPAGVVTNKSKSVAAIVAGLSGSSAYAALYSSTGVNASFAGKGPYTVFVSTDAGYNLIVPGTISKMTAAQKKRFAQYSIVSGKALDIDAQDTGSIKTLSTDELNFSVGPGGVVQVNSSYAIEEYKGSNGIVYVLNQPLLPPTSKNILTP